MSIFALEIIADMISIPVSVLVGQMVDYANAHRCNSDDLSEAIAMGILWGKTWPDVVEEAIGYFDRGMNLEAVTDLLKEQWLERTSRLRETNGR